MHICRKSIHILKGCSFPVGPEEKGYGTQRLCNECHFKQNGGDDITEMNAIENWRGMIQPKVKKSKNLSRQSDWQVENAKFEKKVEIGFLHNAYAADMKSVKIENRRTVSFRKSFAFDCVAQT